MSKRSLALGTGLFCLCTLTFCPFAFGQLPEVRIGILNELTGPLASLGAVCSRGARVAAAAHAKGDRIGGLPLKLVWGDERDDAKTAVTEFQRMVDIEGIQAIIAVRSRGAMPINPLAERLGIPVVGIVGANQFLETNRYALRVYTTPRQDGAFEASLASKLGITRAALISAEDEYTLAMADAIAAALKENGGKVLLQETAPSSETDFSTIISRIRIIKPDAVFVNMLGKSGLVVRKLREAAVPTQIFSHYWIQQPEQIQVAGVENLEGLIFNEVDSEKPVFKAAYAAGFPKEEYNPAAYLCYAALGTVLQALSSPGALKSQESIREAIVNVNKVQLLDSKLEFSNREAKFELVARTFRNGQVTNYPPD